MSNDSRPPSWWQTVPGALTAVAAFITAATGLVLALDQVGLLPSPEASRQVAAAHPSSSLSTPTDAQSTPPQDNQGPVLEPALREIELGEAKYQFLRVVTQTRNLDTFSLHIQVRLLNESPYPANFWDSTFRLLVDGVPRSPVSHLNEVVDGRSAKEGEVEFIVPSSATSLVLQLHHSSESAEVPFRYTEVGR